MPELKKMLVGLLLLQPAACPTPCPGPPQSLQLNGQAIIGATQTSPKAIVVDCQHSVPCSADVRDDRVCYAVVATWKPECLGAVVQVYDDGRVIFPASPTSVHATHASGVTVGLSLADEPLEAKLWDNGAVLESGWFVLRCKPDVESDAVEPLPEEPDAGTTCPAPHRDHVASHPRSGCNLRGWEFELGDAVIGEVSDADFIVEHFESPDCFTRITANSRTRADVMVHVIAFLGQPVPYPSPFNGTAGYDFRLPEPAPRGETVEGAMFFYAGMPAQVDAGSAFQWVVNDQDLARFERLFRFSAVLDGQREWVDTGQRLARDMAFHRVDIAIDFDTEQATLDLDALQPVVGKLAYERKLNFGSDQTARLQAELISRYPGKLKNGGGRHAVEFSNWRWELFPRIARSNVDEADCQATQ